MFAGPERCLQFAAMKFCPGFRLLRSTAKRGRKIKKSAPRKVSRASAGDPCREEGTAGGCILMHHEFKRIRHKADRAGPIQAKGPRQLSIGGGNIRTRQGYEKGANTFGEPCGRHL